MSVEADVSTAVSFTGIPVYRKRNTGTASTYFILMVDSVPTRFRNNRPTKVRYSIVLHLVAPITYDDVSIRDSIKDALFSAGFSYPDLIDASNDKESEGTVETRIIFEFSCARKI